MTRTGRTLSYAASDRDAHYTGTIPATRCPVCLVGMAATHGRSDIAYAAPDPAPAPSNLRSREEHWNPPRS